MLVLKVVFLEKLSSSWLHDSLLSISISLLVVVDYFSEFIVSSFKTLSFLAFWRWTSRSLRFGFWTSRSLSGFKTFLFIWYRRFSSWDSFELVESKLLVKLFWNSKLLGISCLLGLFWVRTLSLFLRFTYLVLLIFLFLELLSVDSSVRS